MGSYVSRLLPLILGVSFLFKFEKKYFFNLIILLISGILVMLSGERLSRFLLYWIINNLFFINKKICSYSLALSIIIFLLAKYYV